MARPWVLTSYPTGLYAWISDKSSSVGSTSTAADEDHPPKTRRRATDEVAGERIQRRKRQISRNRNNGFTHRVLTVRVCEKQTHIVGHTVYA